MHSSVTRMKSLTLNYDYKRFVNHYDIRSYEMLVLYQYTIGNVSEPGRYL